MFDDYNKKLRLTWAIISIAVLLQLGWLLTELYHLKSLQAALIR